MIPIEVSKEFPRANPRTIPIYIPNRVNQGYKRISKRHAKYNSSQSRIWILKWGFKWKHHIKQSRGSKICMWTICSNIWHKNSKVSCRQWCLKYRKCRSGSKYHNWIYLSAIPYCLWWWFYKNICKDNKQTPRQLRWSFQQRMWISTRWISVQHKKKIEKPNWPFRETP